MPLIRLFFHMCLFDKGPQDSPPSVLLLGLTVTGNLVVGTGLSLGDIDWPEALVQSLTAILLLAGSLGAALMLAHKTSRLMQTATAAFGCDALVSALALPLLIWTRLTPEAKGVAGILLLLLMLWQMAVIGHIVRHALSVSFAAGMGFSLLYTAVSYRIMITVFPVLA